MKHFILFLLVVLVCSCARKSYSHKGNWQYGKYSKDLMSNGDTLVGNMYDSLFIIRITSKDTLWLTKPVTE